MRGSANNNAAHGGDWTQITNNQFIDYCLQVRDADRGVVAPLGSDPHRNANHEHIVKCAVKLMSSFLFERRTDNGKYHDVLLYARAARRNAAGIDPPYDGVCSLCKRTHKW